MKRNFKFIGTKLKKKRAEEQKIKMCKAISDGDAYEE